MKQAITICLLNQKGGVGKSTIAVNLAIEFSKLYKTLLIDCDPQGSGNDFSNARSQMMMDLNDLTVCAKPFRTVDGREINGKLVRQEIKTFKEDYDIILIDSPGKSGVLGKALASVSNLVIVPIPPGFFDIWGSDETFAALREVMDIDDDIQARVLMNRRDDRTTLSKELSAFLKNNDVMPLETTFGHRTIYGQSGGGMSVVEIDHHSEAAREVLSLLSEIEIIVGLKEQEKNDNQKN